MNNIDVLVQNYFSTVRTHFLTGFMYFLTSIFDITDLVSLVRFLVIVLCVSVLILWFRNKKYVYLFISAILAGAVASTILKYLFNVARPLGAVIKVSGQSFPSYHATIATIFFVMLMYIFDSYFKTVGRIIFNTICVIGIILISVSRLYLGVHWLSDILGGVVLGLFMSYASIKLFKYYSKK